jgi:hypothetical protein
VTCRLTVESVQPGAYAATIEINVSSPGSTVGGVLSNEVSVEGGGIAGSTAVLDTPIGEEASFEVAEFAFQPGVAGALSSSQAGAHPWELTTSIGIPSEYAPPNTNRDVETSRNIKDIAVEVPAGLVGDPLATGRIHGDRGR